MSLSRHYSLKSHPTRIPNSQLATQFSIYSKYRAEFLKTSARILVCRREHRVATERLTDTPPDILQSHELIHMSETRTDIYENADIFDT